jgi:hypothetical protein
MMQPLLDRRQPFWQRLDLLPWLYALLILVLCVVAAWRPLSGSEDFWAHAAVGRWIYENRTVPHQTLFLWSAAEPWTAHPWLAQLLFYGLTILGPSHAFSTVLLGFTAGLVAFPFLLAWYVAARKGLASSWMLIPFSLGIILNFPWYHARPDLFTTLFITLLLLFLIRWSESHESRPAWAGAELFALFVAWVNLHPGVVIGLMLLAFTVVCDFLQDGRSRRTRMLALLALLAPVALCVNPYVLDYWTFQPVARFRFFLYAEWFPPWRVRPVPVSSFAIQGLLLVLAGAAWICNPLRRLSHLAWLLSMIGLYAVSLRAGWLLTVVSLVVLGANMNGLVPDDVWQRICRRRLAGQTVCGPVIPITLRWIVRVGLVSWLLLQISTRTLALSRFDRPYLPVQLETGVVEFTRKHGLAGRMFNDVENSRYLEWRLGGDPSLFIDAQGAYPREVARDYQDMLKATTRGRRLLHEREIGFVVLTVSRLAESAGALAQFLDNDKRWKRVYAGWDGIIWVRRTKQYAHLWQDERISPDAVPLDRLEYWTRQEISPSMMFLP